MSSSHPIAGVHALRLADEHAGNSPDRIDGPDVDGRKRRRIAPITPTQVLSTSDREPGLTEFGRTSDATLSAAPLNYDHLLVKWATGDDSIVDFSKDEEEEECFSDISDGDSGAQEMGEFENEEPVDLLPQEVKTKSSNMSEDRIVEIINEHIELYTNAWTPGKDETRHKSENAATEVPVVYDPKAMWEEAEAAGTREELAEKYGLEAEYHRGRLDKLCAEIVRYGGDTKAINMRCRNLEVTVELLERAVWLSELYTAADGSHVSQNDLSQTSAAKPLKYSKHFDSQVEVIDLGTPSGSEDSEDSEVDVDTSPARPAQYIDERPSDAPIHLSAPHPLVLNTVEDLDQLVETPIISNGSSRATLGDAPEHASIVAVRRWKWTQLEETQDRKRVVSKAICDLSAVDKETIRQRLNRVGRAGMIREIPACINMLLRDENKLPGILPQDLPKILTFTKLFLCWWLCGNYFAKQPSKSQLEELADCLRDRSPDPATFCDYVDTVLGTTFSQTALNNPTQPSQVEIIEISDDDE